MEIAGLAVGVLSVANVCATCVQAFNMIGTAREADIDYELLSIKLDIEKTRLLQWSEGVGLLSRESGGQNSTLLVPSIEPQLRRILEAIKTLLTKSEDLSALYGLVWKVSDAQEPPLAISSRRTQEFEAALEEVQPRSPARRKKVSSTTKWVIKDREKFTRLLNNLHELISSLNDLIIVPKTFQRLMIKEDIENLGNDLSGLRKLQIASLGQPNEWSEYAGSQIAASQVASQDLRTVEEWLEDVDSRPGGTEGSIRKSANFGVVERAEKPARDINSSPESNVQRRPTLSEADDSDRFSQSSTPTLRGRKTKADQTASVQSLLTDNSTIRSMSSFGLSSNMANIPQISKADCMQTLSSVSYSPHVQTLSQPQMLYFLSLLDCILTIHVGGARAIFPMFGPNYLRKGRRTVLHQQVQALRRLVPHYEENLSTDPSLFGKPSDPMKYVVNMENGQSFTVTRSFQRMKTPPSYMGEIGMKRVLWTVICKPLHGPRIAHFWLLEHFGDAWIVRTSPSRLADSTTMHAANRSVFGFLTV